MPEADTTAEATPEQQEAPEAAPKQPEAPEAAENAAAAQAELTNEKVNAIAGDEMQDVLPMKDPRKKEKKPAKVEVQKDDITLMKELLDTVLTMMKGIENVGTELAKENAKRSAEETESLLKKLNEGIAQLQTIVTQGGLTLDLSNLKTLSGKLQQPGVFMKAVVYVLPFLHKLAAPKVEKFIGEISRLRAQVEEAKRQVQAVSPAAVAA